MGTHAKLSPSSAERWFNCAGSLNLIATLPESAFKGNKYSAEGVVAHSLAEDFVTGKIDLLGLTARIGEEIMEQGYPIIVDDAMVDGVIEYADYIAFVKKRMARKPAGVNGEAEKRVIVSDFAEDVYGTADYILWQVGDELHVFDFKYGKGVVEAEENKQGSIYVVGAHDSLKRVAFGKFFFHIVQPRARHSDGSIRTWEITPERLEEFRKDLAAAVARTKDQKAPRVAGPWCHKTFCPALAYCAEARGAIEGGVGAVFTKIPAPPSKEVALGLHLPPVSSMTVEQLGKALDWEDYLDSFMGAVRERMNAELLKDPNASADYKLVEGKTNRKWGSDEEAEAAFAMLGDERYAPKKIKSPAQMEALAGKEEVAKYTIKPAGRLTVAKMSDKRQAAGPVAPGNAGAVFGVIETTAVKAAEEENIFGDLGGTPAAPKLLGVGDRRGPLWPA